MRKTEKERLAEDVALAYNYYLGMMEKNSVLSTVFHLTRQFAQTMPVEELEIWLDHLNSMIEGKFHPRYPLKDNIEKFWWGERSNRRIVKVHYAHTHTESYEFNELVYCPHCGNQGVWIECSEEAPNHQCTNCGAAFTLQLDPPPTKDQHTQQRIVQLIST
jgi:hypothetical protein